LKPSFQAFCAALVTGGALFSTAAWSHGGEAHDHADAARPTIQPTQPSQAIPRAAAATEDFELVAALESDRLVIYLDRFATDEPVADAKLELESGAFKATAAALSPGVYALPAQPFAVPGSYPLTISVEAGELFDLLSLTLEHGATETAASSPSARGAWPVWGASAGVLLAGVGLVAVRRRRQAGRRQR